MLPRYQNPNPDDAAEHVARLDLDELLQQVAAIYSPNASKRSVWDISFHACHHSAVMSAAIRISNSEQAITNLADFAFWLFTLAGRICRPVAQETGFYDERSSVIATSEPLTQSMWRRISGACIVCARADESVTSSSVADQISCTCPLDRVSPTDKSTQTQRDVSEHSNSVPPSTIAEWDFQISSLLQGHANSTDLDLCSRLLESLGFLYDAMVRMYTYRNTDVSGNDDEDRALVRVRQQRLEHRIADTTIWLFLLSKKILQPRILPSGLSLAWVIASSYATPEGKLWCPFCRHAQCDCRPFFAPEDLTCDRLLGLLGQI